LVQAFKFVGQKQINKYVKHIAIGAHQDYVYITSQIHPNLGELYNLLITLNADMPEHIKSKIKSLYDSRKNYKKYMEEQAQISDKYIFYSTVIPVFDHELECLEETGIEFAALTRDKKNHHVLGSLKKEISLSIKTLNDIRYIFETELLYMRNLMELSSRFSIPQRFKLELFIPGRRFLQSTLVDHYLISNGKLKPHSQVLVFHFNDIIVFSEVKGKEIRRMSTNLRTSPNKIPKKHKVVEYMLIDNLTVKTKCFGSDNIVELITHGKKMIIGLCDEKAGQELIKNLTSHITFTTTIKEESKPDITDYETHKRERKSARKTDKI